MFAIIEAAGGPKQKKGGEKGHSAAQESLIFQEDYVTGIEVADMVCILDWNGH